jgi:hypothetical protein
MNKLNLHSLLHLVRYAIRNGVVHQECERGGLGPGHWQITLKYPEKCCYATRFAFEQDGGINTSAQTDLQRIRRTLPVPNTIVGFMKSRTSLRKDSVTYQLECAQQVVSILFEKTGLSAIFRDTPTVTVGDGNWISFSAHQAVSSGLIFGLAASSGKLAFAPGLFNRRGQARSKTSPSLHLTNLDSGAILRGHVDAHYWAKHPLAHADEFLRSKTRLPSDLLSRLQA